MLIVDENGFQAMGTTEEILRLDSIEDKFRSFGFDTQTVDGHDELEIDRTITNLFSLNSLKPKALIAKTVKGKGVPFMENNNIWHYTRLNADTYALALEAVKSGSI